MISYLIRRAFYMIPILVGVNILTFALFFIVNTPDDVARMHLGFKYSTQDAVEDWKETHGYQHPLFYNAESSYPLTETIFYQKSVRLFAFDFGLSDDGRDIAQDIKERMWPSLAIAVPTLILGLLVNLSIALFVAFYRFTRIDKTAMILCVAMMSISGLFYIVGAQYFFAKMLKWAPISGYRPGLAMISFIVLPVLVGIIGGIGSGTRWYRTLFLEEINKDYVRTARAKGLSERKILWGHVLRNALIPIVTGVVVILPLLFMGSLLLESFFAIPGLGSYTIDAIAQQDFAIIRCIVFLGSFLFILGLLLTDIVYTWVDPRVRLE